MRARPATGHLIERAAAEARLSAAIVDLMDSLHQGLMAGMKAQELTPALALTLKLLDEPRSMRWLADSHQCDASNITGIVDRLERRGLVERHTDPADRRVTLITRTPPGDQIRDWITASATQMMSGIGRLDGHDLDTLTSLLARLVD